MNTIKLNDDEVRVAALAVEALRKAQARQAQKAEFMNTKQFNYGDVVIKRGASRADAMFGLTNGEVGIVVGHYELEGLNNPVICGNLADMFRVYFDKYNCYVGTDAASIERYYGDVPEHLQNVTWNEIRSIEVPVSLSLGSLVKENIQ